MSSFPKRDKHLSKIEFEMPMQSLDIMFRKRALHKYVHIIRICGGLYMRSTTVWLLQGVAPPLVVLSQARWQQVSELCSAHCGDCHLLCSANPSPLG